jgi:hypothetical protein
VINPDIKSLFCSCLVIVVVVAISQGVSLDVDDRLHQHLQHVATAKHQLVNGTNLLQKSEKKKKMHFKLCDFSENVTDCFMNMDMIKLVKFAHFGSVFGLSLFSKLPCLKDDACFKNGQK